LNPRQQKEKAWTDQHKIDAREQLNVDRQQQAAVHRPPIKTAVPGDTHACACGRGTHTHHPCVMALMIIPLLGCVVDCKSKYSKPSWPLVASKYVGRSNSVSWCTARPSLEAVLRPSTSHQSTSGIQNKQDGAAAVEAQCVPVGRCVESTNQHTDGMPKLRSPQHHSATGSRLENTQTDRRHKKFMERMHACCVRPQQWHKTDRYTERAADYEAKNRQHL